VSSVFFWKKISLRPRREKGKTTADKRERFSGEKRGRYSSPADRKEGHRSPSSLSKNLPSGGNKRERFRLHHPGGGGGPCGGRKRQGVRLPLEKEKKNRDSVLCQRRKRRRNLFHFFPSLGGKEKDRDVYVPWLMKGGRRESYRISAALKEKKRGRRGPPREKMEGEKSQYTLSSFTPPKGRERGRKGTTIPIRKGEGCLS